MGSQRRRNKRAPRTPRKISDSARSRGMNDDQETWSADRACCCSFDCCESIYLAARTNEIQEEKGLPARTRGPYLAFFFFLVATFLHPWIYFFHVRDFLCLLSGYRLALSKLTRSQIKFTRLQDHSANLFSPATVINVKT